jgi:ribosome maturation factor RimP
MADLLESLESLERAVQDIKVAAMGIEPKDDKSRFYIEQFIKEIDTMTIEDIEDNIREIYEE